MLLSHGKFEPVSNRGTVFSLPRAKSRKTKIGAKEFGIKALLDLIWIEIDPSSLKSVKFCGGQKDSCDYWSLNSVDIND